MRPLTPPVPVRFVALSALLACATGSWALAACSSTPGAAEPVSGRCITAAQSGDSESGAQKAAPPFSDCAAQLDMHCGGEDRYALCSYPLNAARTAAARKTQPDACCFGDPE